MRLVYLLRIKKRIMISYHKPKGLSFLKNKKLWFFNGSSYVIGQIHYEFHYNSIDVLGVFDIDNEDHFDNLIQAFESHLRQYLEQKILSSLEKRTPIRKNNTHPPSGPGGFSDTPVAQAVLETCRRGGIELW